MQASLTNILMQTCICRPICIFHHTNQLWCRVAIIFNNERGRFLCICVNLTALACLKSIQKKYHQSFANFELPVHSLPKHRFCELNAHFLHVFTSLCWIHRKTMGSSENIVMMNVDIMLLTV